MRGSLYDALRCQSLRDLLINLGLACALLVLYVACFSAVDTSNFRALSFHNAYLIVHWEKELGIFVEPSIQSFFLSSRPLMDLLSFIYVTSQTLITFSVLLCLYARRRALFFFARNTIILAELVALPVFLLFPVAAPRFLPRLGFTDVILGQALNAAGARTMQSGIDTLAAMPSLHVTYALIISTMLFVLLKKRRILRWTSISWTLILSLATVATANHWLLDIFGGTLLFALCLALNLFFVSRWKETWRLPQGILAISDKL
jgi:membrane-associated phospholipid phosphatase